MKNKVSQLRVKLTLGLITLVIGLLASNLALFHWVERASFHYLLGYYARYVCGYGGFAAMILGAMQINDFLALRSLSKNTHEAADGANTSFDGIKDEEKKIVTDKRKGRRKKNIAVSLAISLSMLCPTVVFPLVSYNATVMITPKSVGGTMWLYVDADDMTRTDWKRFGANPYLNIVDYDSNYVFVKGTRKEVGDFDFADSGKSTETIEDATVQLYSKQNREGDNLEVVIWNGSLWISLGPKELPVSWNWVNWTASSQLNSWTKIDGVKMYVVSHRQPGVNEFLVDCARLQIIYSSEL